MPVLHSFVLCLSCLKMTQHHDDGNETLQTPNYSVLCLICHIMPNKIENKFNKLINFRIEQNTFLQI